MPFLYLVSVIIYLGFHAARPADYTSITSPAQDFCNPAAKDTFKFIHI